MSNKSYCIEIQSKAQFDLLSQYLEKIKDIGTLASFAVLNETMNYPH
ncbi:hypothetical protein [Neptuniibacter sp. QD37_11]